MSMSCPLDKGNNKTGYFPTSSNPCEIAKKQQTAN
jgi:hypothetical protein